MNLLSIYITPFISINCGSARLRHVHFSRVHLLLAHVHQHQWIQALPFNSPPKHDPQSLRSMAARSLMRAAGAVPPGFLERGKSENGARSITTLISERMAEWTAGFAIGFRKCCPEKTRPYIAADGKRN